MVPTRRRLLRLAATGAVAASTATAGWLALGDGDDPTRCRGDPVSVTHRAADGSGDEVEYVPENDTVRYPKYRSGDDVVAYGTMPFAEYAAMQCAEAALARAVAVTADRVGSDGFGSGVGEAPGVLPLEPVVYLTASRSSDRDGDLESRNEVPRAQLVEHGPRTVAATYALAGQTYSRSVPVFAERRVLSRD